MTRVSIQVVETSRLADPSTALGRITVGNFSETFEMSLDLVDTLAPAEPETVATVAEQEQYWTDASTA
jgi:hypothetical protein